MGESFSSLVHSGSSECCYLLMRSSSFVGKVVIEGAAPGDGFSSFVGNVEIEGAAPW